MTATPSSIDTPQPRPLISFIVAYHDEPIDWLRACLDSIMTLSLGSSEREIIVVDDGSAASPLSGLQDILDDIVYVRQRHLGLSEARNRGIDTARGLFLQFVDADDRLIAPPYEQCLDIVRYREADMVMFRCTDCYDSTFQPVAVTPVSGSRLMREDNIRGSACGYLFSRHILGTLRFIPGIYHEDEAFTPQLLLRAEAVFNTPYKAYYYRKRTDSITRTADRQTVSQRLDDTLAVIVRLYRRCDTLPPADQPAMERRVAQLSMDYLYNTIVLTRSGQSLDKAIDSLQQQGLFPLPDRPYSKKYTWFRRLVSHRLGRHALLATLPLLPRH